MPSNVSLATVDLIHPDWITSQNFISGWETPRKYFKMESPSSTSILVLIVHIKLIPTARGSTHRSDRVRVISFSRWMSFLSFISVTYHSQHITCHYMKSIIDCSIKQVAVTHSNIATQQPEMSLHLLRHRFQKKLLIVQLPRGWR